MSHPLPLYKALMSALVIVLAMGVYCLAYNMTQGRTETVWNAFSWPIINLLPFFAAFELGKRFSGWAERAAVLLGAATLSVGLEWFNTVNFEAVFEAVRRIPAVLIVITALVTSDYTAVKAPRSADGSNLPLLPHQIDWVAAAGNYVILHGASCRVFHRATLTETEIRLKPHGFVRVHRSRLVRRDAVARVRSVDLILNDGTSIATGMRFRNAVDHWPI